MIVATLLLVAGVSFLADGEGNARKENSLKAFLRDYLLEPGVPAGDMTRSSRWCGSGGCMTFVLVPQGPSYKIVATITISRPPIRVMSARSHGCHDIGVWVQGGGIQPGFEADLQFDGKTYRENPSAPPPGGWVQTLLDRSCYPGTPKALSSTSDLSGTSKNI